MAEDNGDEVPLMDKIKHLKELVQNLEEMAVSSEHQAHIASAIIEEHKTISNYLDKMKHSAEEEGRYFGSELLRDLINPYRQVFGLIDDGYSFWDRFHDKLKVLAGTSEVFRNCCFSTTLSGNVIMVGGSTGGDTLLHVLCNYHPPVEVVRTLIDILPARPIMQSNGYETLIVNHLACNRDGHYPLHKVLGFRGSLEVVKLLVNVDIGKQTLKMTKDDKDSVCCN